jgi:hypothetical protein
MLFLVAVREKNFFFDMSPFRKIIFPFSVGSLKQHENGSGVNNCKKKYRLVFAQFNLKSD